MWSLISSAAATGALWLGGKLGIEIQGVVWPVLGGKGTAIAFATFYLCFGGDKTLWLWYKTGKRDITALFRLLKVKFLNRGFRGKNMTLPRHFQEVVQRHPYKVALIFEDTKWTFAQLDEYSNQIANCVIQNGFQPGDCIAIYMENRLEYVGAWLGCAKAGVIAALINSNQRGHPLVHSITSSKAKAIFCGAELQESLAHVKDDDMFSQEKISVWVQGPMNKKLAVSDWNDLDIEMLGAPKTVPETITAGNYADNLLFIYTSGTTGLPKAAIIKHARYFFFASGVFYMLNLSHDDIIYNPLPLYHTAGGIVGIGQVLVFGSTAVIRKKFSASNYWIESKKHDCTVGQYVGEICRYLLNSPKKPEETQHKIRLMFGNGVRAQIWEEFTKRFNMPHIAEFYGSTEGNTNIVNYEGVPKACGFVPMIMPWAYPVRLIRIDPGTGSPVRDSKGFCVFCKPGQPGEFVGKILKGDAVGDFHGYVHGGDTEKKIIRNVFSKGDYAFSSGDMLVMDDMGYVYFKDRLGDTFRWRGENVSATEVENAISAVLGNTTSVVFGVEVPGAEGRAGMAAIVDPDEKIDLDDLRKKLEEELPAYALPVFIKVLSHIDMTGTFKLIKTDVKKKGYKVDVDDDKIFFYDPKKKQYVPLTQQLHHSIESGKSGL